jgi:hypothetical protein
VPLTVMAGLAERWILESRRRGRTPGDVSSEVKRSVGQEIVADSKGRKGAGRCRCGNGSSRLHCCPSVPWADWARQRLLHGARTEDRAALQVDAATVRDCVKVLLLDPARLDRITKRSALAAALRRSNLRLRDAPMVLAFTAYPLATRGCQ